MASWEEFGSTYMESIANKLPLHRVFLFCLGFLGVQAARNQSHLSIAETIVNLRLGDLISLQSALLENSTFADLLLGLSASFAGWGSASLLAMMLFAVVAKGCNLNGRNSSALELSKKDISMNPRERREEAEFQIRGLEQPRVGMMWRNSLCETWYGVSVVFFVATAWGNVLDLVIAIAALIGGCITTVGTLRYFFREYYGPALFVAQLEGRRPPTLP